MEKDKLMEKDKSIAECLSALEKKYNISGNELARRIGMATNDYHNKYKKNHRHPTLWQRIAFTFLDRYGFKEIRNNL